MNKNTLDILFITQTGQAEERQEEQEERPERDQPEQEERPEDPIKKKLNGWQVFIGEKGDDLLEDGASFAEASSKLKEQWRSLQSAERTAYNEIGKEGVMVDVKCGICHKVFPSTSRKNQHQKSCGGVNCSICNRKFTSKRVMQEHYNSQHTVLFRCAQCGKCFGGLSKLNRHKTVHNETNTCECGKSFSRIDNLNKHKKTHAEQQ